MAAAAKGKPEVLLLEGARPAWRVGGGEAQQLVDALPYFDKEYEDAAVRAEVNRLVQEEMRRSRKRPADFLKELPPVPPLRPEVQTQPPLCLLGVAPCSIWQWPRMPSSFIPLLKADVPLGAAVDAGHVASAAIKARDDASIWA